MNKYNLNTINWGDRTELIEDKAMQSDIWAIFSLDKVPILGVHFPKPSWEGLQSEKEINTDNFTSWKY